MRNHFLALLLMVFCSSCASLDVVDSDAILEAESVIASCINKLEHLAKHSSMEQVDHIYVYVFEEGYLLSFFKEAKGTFGKIGLDSRTIWACGVSDNKVIFLGAPLRDPLIDDMDRYDFENYDEDVIEILFKRVGNEFEYCCSQKFDEKNIYKHNPDPPWNENMVS